jgi:hypothetical protein
VVELTHNPWGSVLHHEADGALELRWLPSTADMSDDDFEATLELFAAEAERTGASFLLIDATQFRHRPGPGVMDWRDENIIPRYERAGVERLAFHMPSDFPGEVVERGATPAPEGGASFPTGRFLERSGALAWLRGS